MSILICELAEEHSVLGMLGGDGTRLALLGELSVHEGLVLDLRRTEYVDASFVGLLAGLARRCPGRIVLCHVRPNVRQLLELCEMDRVCPLAEDLATALAHLGADSADSRLTIEDLVPQVFQAA